jgi:hypothetical protein
LLFLLVIFLSPASNPVYADEPPIELPPITVIAPKLGSGFHYVCGALNPCDEMLGAQAWYSILEEEADQIGEGGDAAIIVLPVEDIPNNPSNQEANANCNSDEEIRTNHANQDIGPVLMNLDIGDMVRIHYGSGETELAIIKCKVCSVPAELIPATCS